VYLHSPSGVKDREREINQLIKLMRRLSASSCLVGDLDRFLCTMAALDNDTSG